MNRRRLLRGLVAGVPLFAGCNALSGQGETNHTNSTATTATTPTTTANTTTKAGTNTTEHSTTETEAAKTNRDESTSSTKIPYASMIPVPSDPSDFDFEFYRFDALRKRQREFADLLPGSTDENATYPGVGGFEIPFTEIDTLLIADVDVVIGPFKKDSIRTTLKHESDAQLQETYKGYDIYVEPDRGSATAFSGDTLISDLLPEPSLSELKATIDVINGDGKRFYDVNDDFRTLVDVLGNGLVVAGQFSPDAETENVRDDAGIGFTVAAEDRTPVFTIAILFETADATDIKAVRELLLEDPEFKTYYNNLKHMTTKRTGRVVTFTGEFNPEQTPTTPVTTTTKQPTATTPATTGTRTTATSRGQLVLSPLSSYTNTNYGYQIDYPES